MADEQLPDPGDDPDKLVTCYEVEGGRKMIPQREACNRCAKCAARRRKRDERARRRAESTATEGGEAAESSSPPPSRGAARDESPAGSAASPSEPSQPSREPTAHTNPEKAGDPEHYARPIDFDLKDSSDEGAAGPELDPEIVAIMHRAENLPPLPSMLVGGMCMRLLSNLARLDELGKGVPMLCPSNPEHKPNIDGFLKWYQGVASYTVAMFWPKGDDGQGAPSKWGPPIMCGVTLGGSEITVRLVERNLEAEGAGDAGDDQAVDVDRSQARPRPGGKVQLPSFGDG